MDIFAVTNQQGGAGKSELSKNLAAGFAAMGKKVLVLDLDPQGHLTEMVGAEDLYLVDDDEPNLYKCLLDSAPPEPEVTNTLIFKPENELFWLIPSCLKMMIIEGKLYFAKYKEDRVKRLINTIDPARFDMMIIDCPPFLGNLTDNALIAARQIVIPVQPNRKSIRALNLLLLQIDSLEKELDIQIEILGIVPNLVNLQKRVQKTNLIELREKIPQVTDFEIPIRAIFEDALEDARTIYTYEPKRPDQTQAKSEMTAIYDRLAKLILDKMKGDYNG